MLSQTAEIGQERTYQLHPEITSGTPNGIAKSVIFNLKHLLHYDQN